MAYHSPDVDACDVFQFGHGHHSVGSNVYASLPSQRRNRRSCSVDIAAIDSLVPVRLSRLGDGLHLGDGLGVAACFVRSYILDLSDFTLLGALSRAGAMNRLSISIVGKLILG